MFENISINSAEFRTPLERSSLGTLPGSFTEPVNFEVNSPTNFPALFARQPIIRGEISQPLAAQVYTPVKMSTQTNPPDCAEILESILGEINWISSTEGHCNCPGANLHTSGNNPKDCKLFFGEIPTIHCFHASCQEVVAKTNKELRAALSGGVKSNGKRKRLTKEEKFRMAQQREKICMIKRAEASRDRLIREYSWPYVSIKADSPVVINPDPFKQWQPVISLFEPNDVIWIGSIQDTGKQDHKGCFRTREEWLKQELPLGPFTCPAAFHPETYSRCNSAVINRRFLVVESDVLDKNSVGAIFRWLVEKCDLDLRCIVDTGGKSLHGWFRFPEAEKFEQLKNVLPGLGCDPKMFGASQPCRLPGWPRGTGNQTLIYTKGGNL